MFLNHLKRIFMQAVGEPSGGAGGAPAPTPAPTPAPGPSPAPSPASPAPAATPAQGAAPLDPAQLGRQVADSVFAELRRQGVVGAGTRGRQQAAGDAPAPAAAPSGPVPNDIGRLRALDRALNTTGYAQRLNDAAYARLEREYLAESPEDARTWVSSYFEGFGVPTQAPASAPSPTAGPASPAAAAQPSPSQPAGPPAPTPQPTNQRPASDAGGPPSPSPHIEDLDLLAATPAQRNELVRTKGLKWFNDRLHAQMREKRFQLR